MLFKVLSVCIDMLVGCWKGSFTARKDKYKPKHGWEGVCFGCIAFICITRYRHYLKCPVSWCVCLFSCQPRNQRSTVGFRVEKWWQIESQTSRRLLIETILKAMNSSHSPKMHSMLSLSHRSVPFLNPAPWPPASLMWCVASDFRFIHLGHFYQRMKHLKPRAAISSPPRRS